MLFAELEEAVWALVNPSAGERYQEKVEAYHNPDKAATKTCKEIDVLVCALRTKLEAIRETARASVDSGQFELRMVTQLESQTGSPESTGYKHSGFRSDIHASQVGGESTPIPYTTPTKIKTEPHSPMSLSNEDQGTDETQPDIASPGMRSSSNPEPQGKGKQNPKARLRGAIEHKSHRK